MWLNRSRTAIALTALTVACLAGCGSGGNSNAPSTRSEVSQGAVARSVDHTTKENVGRLLRPHGRVPGRSACTSAVVTKGAEPGVIKFTAHCVGKEKGGPLDFVVLRPQTEIRELEYSHQLGVRESGSLSRRGGCHLARKVLGCSVLVEGEVEVFGQLRVPPATRCTARISLVGLTVARCEGSFCGGDPVSDELFRGRPRGCGQL